MLSRRGLISGLIGLVAAPAIVRASSLMPVRGEPLRIDNKEWTREDMIEYIWQHLYRIENDAPVGSLCIFDPNGAYIGTIGPGQSALFETDGKRWIASN